MKRVENMPQLSQCENTVADKTSLPKILVISRTFLPKEGGIEEYVYNRCLQDPEQIIVLASSCPGDQAFDQAQAFPIYRWLMPAFLRLPVIGGILKQVLNMIWEFVLGVWLYFRYRYQYIEWGHGYDFPALLLLSYVLPVRCFIYLHGDDVLCPLRNPLLRSLFQLTLARMQGIACNSTFTQDYLKAQFQFDTPTYIINPTVRPEKFGLDKQQNKYSELRIAVRNAYQIPESAVVILSVGRLVSRKGFDRIIENLPLLLAKNLNVHYLACGRGPMEAELKSLAKQLNVEDRVHFAGFVPDDQLASYYAACDLFAMITFFDSKAASIEGFGIVYREAGYFGKPVVAAKIGGVVDAVHHNESGLLVDPNSANEIFDALYRLCIDQPLRNHMGQQGKKLADCQTPHRVLYSSAGV